MGGLAWRHLVGCWLFWGVAWGRWCDGQVALGGEAWGSDGVF